MPITHNVQVVEKWSLISGFAKDASESAYPELWEGLRFGWAPSLGIQGSTLVGVGPVRTGMTLSNGNVWGLNRPPMYIAPTFNGTSDTAQTAATLDLTGTTRLSVVYWLYWNAFSNNDDLAWESSDDFNVNAGAIQNNPNWSGVDYLVGITNSAGTGACFRSFTRPTAAVWHHYLLVLDLTATWATAVNALYLDGVPITLTDVTADVTAPSSFGNYI